MPKKKAVAIKPSEAELDYKEFGNILRTYIKAKGYTQAVFAEAIGISYSYMMNILQGKRRIPLHIYMKIIDVLELTDIVLMCKNPAENNATMQKSQLYLEFLPLIHKMSPAALENFIGLAKEVVNNTAKESN